jgi:Pyruvate kinase, barrel domain
MLRTSASAIGKLSSRGGRSVTTAWRTSAAAPLNSSGSSTCFFSSSSWPLQQAGAQQQQKLLPIKTTFDLPDPAAVFDGHHGDNGGHTSFPLAKIVATIGPTSEQKQPLLDVSAAGMRIMRLNFSHATVEEVELRVANLAAAQVCMFVCCLLLLWS